MYQTSPKTNRLLSIDDSYTTTATHPNDLEDQGANNYAYDQIGNLTSDTQEGLSLVVWTPSNKIDSIATAARRIAYTYDATGNRVRKRVWNTSNVLQSTTWYVRDPQGSPLAIYTKAAGDIKLSEVPLYGSDRIGMIKPEVEITMTPFDTIGVGTPIETHRYAAQRFYELKDHLGNVRAVVNDEVVRVETTGEYLPTVVSKTDYYPFGMAIDDRRENQEGYRYGFNGKENDNEVKGEGNSISFEARMYDPRNGRWMSPDALANKYPSVSPFVFALNTPIMAVDPDGNVVIFINGQHAGTGGTAVYWGGYDSKVMNKIGDQSARYVDGALAGWKNTGTNAGVGALAGFADGFIGSLTGAALNVVTSSNVNMNVRIAAGQAQGLKDAADIIANLQEGETIKIVTHSMGTAFARGYTEGILKYAQANGLADRVKFRYELDVNSFQGGDLSIDKNVEQTQNKTGGLDGGKSLMEVLKGNSVPKVAPVPRAEDTSTESDKTKGHAVNQMSLDRIPKLGNGGNAGSVEQGSNNEKKP